MPMHNINAFTCVFMNCVLNLRIRFYKCESCCTFMNFVLYLYYFWGWSGSIP